MKQSQYDLFQRESWLWCAGRVFSSLVGLDLLFFGDTLQNAKQVFSVTLPQMTKYCVMRECENIRRGYLYDGDLAFVILKGFYGFKFPKKVFGDLLQRSHSFLNHNHLKTLLPNHWCPFPLHSHGSMPFKQQSHIPTMCFMFVKSYIRIPFVLETPDAHD
jgi:hypothetical protein